MKGFSPRSMFFGWLPLLMLLGGCLFVGGIDDSNTRSRLEYWRMVVGREVPVGTTHADAAKWAADHDIYNNRLDYLPFLNVIVEEEKRTPPFFGCAPIIEVSMVFGPDEKSKSVEVTSPGRDCI